MKKTIIASLLILALAIAPALGASKGSKAQALQIKKLERAVKAKNAALTREINDNLALQREIRDLETKLGTANTSLINAQNNADVLRTQVSILTTDYNSLSQGVVNSLSHEGAWTLLGYLAFNLDSPEVTAAAPRYDYSVTFFRGNYLNSYSFDRMLK